jgi:hypothetical protein
MTTQDTSNNGFGNNSFGRLDIKADATGRMIKDPPKPEQKPTRKTRHEEGYLDHYENGSGTEMRIPPEDMVKSGSINGAMKTNRGRFEDSISKGSVKKKWPWDRQDHPFKDQIISMKDGETKDLIAPDGKSKTDYWDRDLGHTDHVLNGDVNGSLGLGHAKVRSQGTFKATRTGNSVQIQGEVDHEVKDVYDFNEGDPIYSSQRKKATEGDAEPFVIRGRKYDRVRGEIKIKDGDVDDAKFEWDNAD